jgi:hypothetical protein
LITDGHKEDVGVAKSVRDDRQYEISHQLWHPTGNLLVKNYKKHFSLYQPQELPYRVHERDKNEFAIKIFYYVVK